MYQKRVFHLDRLFWKPGWVSISKEELEEKVQEIVCTESWIIDGNYSGTMELRFQAADTIIFLDFPLWTCLWGIFKRRLMYAGKTRPCMTEGCDEKLDLEFLVWVLTFPLKSRKGIIEKLHKYSYVKACISTHRYRNNKPPESIEAKILYDADKLDSTGTMGIARTLIYNGIISQPLYYVDEFGKVLDGRNDNIPSFFREYNWKLKNIYDKFYTDHARIIAEERRKASIEFYENIYNEVCLTHQKGLCLLNDEFR